MVTKKHVRLVILLACGIAFLLASSGCKKKAEEEEKKKEDITFKTPTKKVEDIDITTPPETVPHTEPDINKAIADRVGKTYVIEPGAGIDKVRFGMTVDQMKKILGEPMGITPPLYQYDDAGFAIFALRDVVSVISCGDRRNPDSPRVKGCRCRTKKGIGMGSSREDIMKAYGQPSKTQQLSGNAVVLQYSQLGADFLLTDDKVTHMQFKGGQLGSLVR